MHTVATFDSPVRAMQAVAYLRLIGIAARASTVSSAIVPIVQVLAPSKAQAEEGKRALDKFATPKDMALEVARLSGSPGRMDDGVKPGSTDEEDVQASKDEEQEDLAGLPDLSKLASYLAPPCPGCHRVLPMDASVRACPSCQREVDIPSLIVMYHGPEKLALCYPDEDGEDPVTLDVVSCACGYDLRGLPRQGTCPECGAMFQKPGAWGW